MASAHKYMDIIAWVRRQITEGVFLPGDKFLSEAALQEQFGVSRQTVRRALEELASSGSILRVQGSGTYIAGASPGPALQAKPSASSTIGVISTSLDDYIFPSIIRGIEGVFASSGYGLQLASSQDEVAGETRALQRMLESNLAGLVVEPTKSGLPCVNLDLYHRLEQLGIPLVFTDSHYSELSAPFVAPDDEAVGYLATKYLIDMGHRDIVSIFTHSNRAGRLRYLGHMKALSAHGIPLRDDRVHWYTLEDMHHLVNGELFQASLQECTAALCYNDHLGTALSESLGRRGLSIPKDLSIISVDNTALAQLYGFTSVIHPGERLGEAAAKLLLSIINGAPGESILFPPEIFVRNSVKRLEA